MKKLPLLFAAFLVVSASGLRAGEPSDIHTLLRRLDGLLDRREEFLLRHEARLDSLKSLLCGDTLGFGARYAVTAEIAERYFAYQSDSTIAYLRRNVALAERAGNADLTIRAKSVMAMCYSMNGRFLEADRVLAGATDTLHMSRATQAAYYAAQHRQNRECRSQSEPGAERDRFRACEEYYARRALETTGDISKRFYFAYLVAVDEGDYDRAAAACDSALACAPPASHDYARAAFYRSETERFRGDEAARFEWLVRAAMADVQGAVRDYGALGGVAEELLRRPEIDYPLIAGMIGWGEGITPMLAERLETEIKYAGYIARQDRMIHEVARHEKTLIPEDFSYTELTGLTLEAREKLARIRPKNLGQAGRIPGVSPSDVAQLSIALAAKRR